MNTKNIHIILVLMTFAMFGCSDKKDSSSSCLNQLNEEKYQQVAENSNCSNYHRGSAYLGMAGMSFSNFLKKGASDNLTKTLGIQSLDNASDYSQGNRNYITKALCLVGPDNLTNSNRCNGLDKRSGTRTNYDMEISLFGLIGDMIYVNYGVLDLNLDGTISQAETDNFTGGVSSASSTGINSDNPKYEIIVGSDVYVFDIDTSNPNNSTFATYTDNYTINPTNQNAIQVANILNDIQNNPTTSQIRPIIKLDNMTDITGGTDLTPKLVLTNELFTISSGLNTDLGNIGLEDNSSLRTSLTENLSKLDNGGLKSDGTTCDAAAALDSIYMLFQNAADNSTSDNSTLLKQSNLISLTDLADQFGVNIPSVTATGFENLPMTTARLIYAYDVSGTTYTDSYENAHNILYNSVYNAKSLGAETSSKNDGKVIYREILCIGDN